MMALDLTVAPNNLFFFKPRTTPTGTYCAKGFAFEAGQLRISISGELEGLIDFSLSNLDAHWFTWQLTCDQARELASKLLSAAQDVQSNCLFDNDALLIDERLPTND
jgi:hypothetical protein